MKTTARTAHHRNLEHAMDLLRQALDAVQDAETEAADDDHLTLGDVIEDAWYNAGKWVRFALKEADAAGLMLQRNGSDCPECKSAETHCTDLDREEARRDWKCGACDAEWTTRT